MGKSKYDAALLGPIVATSRSLSEVLRKLSLNATGGNHRMISARIRAAGLDTSHFGYGTIASRIADVPRSRLEELVAKSLSIAQVLVELHMPPDGRSHHTMKRRLRELGIDTSHFRGQGWARGETRQSSAIVDRIAKRNCVPDEEVFVDNSSFLDGKGLLRRLLAMGRKYECAWCGITEWRGQPLVLHLDHINGINNDHRRENLRFLCPNCHSQTTTFAGRNKGRRSGAIVP